MNEKPQSCQGLTSSGQNLETRFGESRSRHHDCLFPGFSQGWILRGLPCHPAQGVFGPCHTLKLRNELRTSVLPHLAQYRHHEMAGGEVN
jgi:hypothetical protein